MKRNLFSLLLLLIGVVGFFFIQKTHSTRGHNLDHSGLYISELWSSGMVLPADTAIELSGRAIPGVEVTVVMDNFNDKVVTNAEGKWAVTLPAQNAGKEVTITIISGEEKRILEDVLFGSVWLCSGQSNMALALKETDEKEQKQVLERLLNSDKLRLYCFHPSKIPFAEVWEQSYLDSLNNMQYYHKSGWEKPSKEFLLDFSAIALSYAATLLDSINAPVGLVLNAVDGSPIESWISSEKLIQNFPKYFEEEGINNFATTWTKNRIALNVKKTTADHQRHPYGVSYLYETGITPLRDFPISGILWYQGESNTEFPKLYSQLFLSLIDDWRTIWNELPFYYVQLTSYKREEWPLFREYQRLAASERDNLYMAVSIDCGDSTNIHSKHKQAIGIRLAKLALKNSFGKDIVASGPEFLGFSQDRTSLMTLSFKNASGLSTSDKKPIRGFEVAGKDGIFSLAEASIDGEKVNVWSKEVPVPYYVRYGWQPFSLGNLINDVGLPAVPFTSKKIGSDGVEE